MNRSFSWDAFNKIPVIGILRNVAVDVIENLVRPYYLSGLTTLEITMNSQGAAKIIASLAAKYGEKLNIGAGTVCTMEELEEALTAGAEFIVTPVINKKIIRECVKNNIPVFPGAYTPTEIYKAWSLGAPMVKVFPATKLGPEFIKDVLAPLPQIKLVPTGGVSPDNFTGFLKAGAKGVGIGSHLFPAELIQHKLWDELSEFYVQFVKRYQDYLNEASLDPKFDKTGGQEQLASGFASL